VIKREKRRYLGLKVVSEQSFAEQVIMGAIQDSVLRLFGEYGASQANVKQIMYLPEKGQLVIRCSHKMLEKVRAAITLTVTINGKIASIHVIGVSGTLKALSKKT